MAGADGSDAALGAVDGLGRGAAGGGRGGRAVARRDDAQRAAGGVCFVVTHELRTPLTTFRMYAEMLARGMVPDAARRQEYFNTLQREAERLTLLVENVLAYARLERGRKPQAQDRTSRSLRCSSASVRGSTQRAQQADMQCDVRARTRSRRAVEFTTDLSVVEQILFNLVDNAAKYARERDRSADSGRSATATASRCDFSVRDHGPGIEPRLVRPADARVRQERAGIGRVGAGRRAWACALPAVGAATGRAAGNRRSARRRGDR